MKKILEKLKTKKLWIAVLTAAGAALFAELGFDVSIFDFLK